MTPKLQDAQPKSVQDLIANAIVAAQAMEKADDLHALLTLAAHEADRIVTASMKKPKQVKAAVKAPVKKTTVKKADAKEAVLPVAQKAAAKTRAKKAHTMNGVAHS